MTKSERNKLADKIVEWAEKADADCGNPFGFVRSASNEWFAVEHLSNPLLNGSDPEWLDVFNNCAVLGLLFVAAIVRSGDLP